MSSWLNINESLNSIKGQISTFANNVLADVEETEPSNNGNDDTEDIKKICIVKDREIEHLKKENEELKKLVQISKNKNEEENDNTWNWSMQEETNKEEEIQNSSKMCDLKLLLESLENEKNDLVNQLEQLDVENQQNLHELNNKREKLQEENSELKDALQKLKKQENFQQKYEELYTEFNILRTTNENLHKIDAENAEKLEKILETYEQEMNDLKNENKENQKQLYNSYIKIITDSLKEYTNTTSYEDTTTDEEPTEKFKNLLKIIFQTLEEFQEKTTDLEQQLTKVSKEKSVLLKETEELRGTSSELHQEVEKKCETIKELELEIKQFIDSNDVLLSELDGYKTSSGGILETIPETNELLENDLENANKRIKELETFIESPVNNDPTDEGGDYFELLNKFDQLKIDCVNLTSDNETLKLKLEKVSAEFENVDYQLSEANFNLESFKEEVENLKEKLRQEMNVKTQLNEITEKWLNEENWRRELQEDVKILTGKLEDQKINLKLLQKEVSASVVLKNELEIAKLNLKKCEESYTDLLTKYDAILVNCEELNTKNHENECENLKLSNLLEELAQIKKEKLQLTQEVEKLKSQEDSALLNQQQIQELTNSRNELIQMVTLKHQENVNYHQEIQRLSELLNNETGKFSVLEAKLFQFGQINDEIAKRNEEIDKLHDEVNFLKEKCEILSKNVTEEQTKVLQIAQEKSEKEKQLERLQSHLMEQEEHFTQELLIIDQKNAENQAKIADLEQREKNSTTMYTSVSIRANQQVESLQNQLQQLTNQRDELRKEISDAEDLKNKQSAALANLQFVLEQFQKDKEKNVLKETERIRKQIDVERKIQEELKTEIGNLQIQLEESKIGLQAASRLSDQLEMLKKQNFTLKEEVLQLQQALNKSQHSIEELSSQTDGKIEKSLIKSLLVGFLSSGGGNVSNSWNKDQTQVLKLIATVLDFNQQDHDKVKLNQSQQQGVSWLGSLLFPQNNNNNNNNANISRESLAQAFVKFLENESTPRVVPSLLSEASMENNKKFSPRPSPSPIVLNEVVLPTFPEFGNSRSSSSILKDVLKDNNR